jgi:Berberine and berberine like
MLPINQNICYSAVLFMTRYRLAQHLRRSGNSPPISAAPITPEASELALAVRGGGHSHAGYGVCDGGVVIDLSGMKRVHQTTGFPAAPIAGFQTSVFLPELSDGAVAAITTATKDAAVQSADCAVPRAVTRVRTTEMAFALRQQGYDVEVAGRWSVPGEKANAVRWVKALRDNLQPFSHGLYVNGLSETSDELVRAAYGPNYARLVEIKKKYDPRMCCGSTRT